MKKLLFFAITALIFTSAPCSTTNSFWGNALFSSIKTQKRTGLTLTALSMSGVMGTKLMRRKRMKKWKELNKTHKKYGLTEGAMLSFNKLGKTKSITDAFIIGSSCICGIGVVLTLASYVRAKP